MKSVIPNLLLAGLIALTFSMCQSPTDKAQTLSNFVEDAFTMDETKLSLKEPIASLRELAQEKAAKTILLNKENINSALNEAKKYKNSIIIVGKHTIVKITDFTDCQKSSSWAAEMPLGAGYIQKEGLNACNGHINQLIGTPDKQARWLFLFN